MSIVMTNLVATVKHYWKLLLLLFTLTTTLTGGAVWVGKVDRHVEQGDKKMEQFDQSEKERARTDEKVDAVLKELGELKQEVRDEFKDIKEQNRRIERKLDRGR